jgi:7 transmembrane sweet-taste receptor of 3 GCPR
MLVTLSELADRCIAMLIQPTLFINFVELYCRKSVTWFLVPLVYNMALMVGCAVLGFFARKLPENFNDSQFIFISVSTTLFVWIMFVPAYFTAYYAYLRSIIIGFCLLSNAGVTLVCQFVRIAYAVLFVPTDKIKFTQTIDGAASNNRVTPLGHHAGELSRSTVTKAERIQATVVSIAPATSQLA